MVILQLKEYQSILSELRELHKAARTHEESRNYTCTRGSGGSYFVKRKSDDTTIFVRSSLDEVVRALRGHNIDSSTVIFYI